MTRGRIIRTNLLGIAVTIFTAVGIVFLLYAASDKMNQTPNGFSRHLLAPSLNRLQVKPLEQDTLPYRFLGNRGLIIRNPTGDSLHTPPFTRGVSISPASFILRGPDPSSKDQVFMKVQGKKVTYEQGISEVHNDAGISTDGTLNFDAQTGLLAYTYFSRNRILCFDTNLMHAFTMHTIDTEATYRPLTIALNGGKSITNDKPMRFVNRYTCTNEGKLYVHSSLKADNEKEEVWSKNAAIDVYDLSGRTYQGSFYLPRLNGEKMKRFRVDHDRIFVGYDDYTAIYSLPNL